MKAEETSGFRASPALWVSAIAFSLMLIGGGKVASAGETVAECTGGLKDCALVDVCVKWDSSGNCIEAKPEFRKMPIRDE